MNYKSPKPFSSSAQQLHFCKVSISMALILFSCPAFPMLAIPVTNSTIFDVERTKSLEVGKPLELECEVADSTVPSCWYKDGKKLIPQNGWDIQSNGTSRKLIIPSAELLHSGLYSCETSDDTIHFTVDAKGDLFLQLNCFTFGSNSKAFWRLDMTNIMICVSVCLC